MAILKTLLKEMVISENETLMRDPYSWDQVQYAELHKHHQMKADLHRQMSKAHEPRKIAGEPHGNKDVYLHHAGMAQMHENAAKSLGQIVNAHINKPRIVTK
jgi:hypothetical protein